MTVIHIATNSNSFLFILREKTFIIQWLFFYQRNHWVTRFSGKFHCVFKVCSTSGHLLRAWDTTFLGWNKQWQLLQKLQSNSSPLLYCRRGVNSTADHFKPAISSCGFPNGSDSKESTCNAGDPGLIPLLGRGPGEKIGYPLQDSCLENSMDRGDWQATVHVISKSQTRLSN